MYSVSCCVPKEKCMDTIEMDYSTADIGRDSWENNSLGMISSQLYLIICAPFFSQKENKGHVYICPSWYTCTTVVTEHTREIYLALARWAQLVLGSESNTGHKIEKHGRFNLVRSRSRCGCEGFGFHRHSPVHICHALRPVPWMHDHPLVHYSDIKL